MLCPEYCNFCAKHVLLNKSYDIKKPKHSVTSNCNGIFSRNSQQVCPLNPLLQRSNAPQRESVDGDTGFKQEQIMFHF